LNQIAIQNNKMRGAGLATIFRIIPFLSMLFPCWAFAEEQAANKGLDAAINGVIEPFATKLGELVFYEIQVGDGSFKWIVVWLIAGAAFFTLYLRFISFRGFRHAVELVRGHYTDPEHPGEVSHLQALTTALSGTVGLGNIAGVAVAISLGGPGATFWMILAGLLGMSSKCAECLLGVKYRVYNPDGSVSGGPMYYLSRGLAERGMAPLGRFLAMFFAICCLGGALGAGNMFQANQSYQMVLSVTGGSESFFADKGWLFGLIIAVVVGSVIIGGIKSIAQVTVRLVPLMAITYFIAATIIILVHLDKVPAAFVTIIEGAFSPVGVAGGFVGVLIQGFQRAAFSNEAGLGSASIAHSAVVTNEPVTEGLVALLEPFIDTVVICTMTALVIIITGSYTGDGGGVELTSRAFATTLPWFPYVLAVAVVLFAFSTILSWSYYGTKSWTYLFGESQAAELTFKFIMCSFAVVGCTMQLDSVLLFSDSMIFLMGLFNVAGLYLLAPVIKAELEHYWVRLQTGQIKKYEWD
jgi:AGCS family alanine or glycine:cation symporter